MNRKGKGARTILIVEDYDDVRRMLKLLLESEQFRVLEAANGAEALDTVKTGQPDLIVTDLGLPGFDGFEIIRRIRRIDGFQNTPIIVLTAHNEQSAHETAVSAGANYFMAKPVDFDRLESLLQQILLQGKGKTPKYERGRAQRAVSSDKKSVSHSNSCERRWAF